MIKTMIKTGYIPDRRKKKAINDEADSDWETIDLYQIYKQKGSK